MREFETIGRYHDHWSYVLVSAPDRFREIGDDAFVADQQKELEDAFDQLRSGFHFAERKLKDERLAGIAAELIEMSLEAYLAGDTKTGAHTLQECEGLIWPSYRQNVKYAIEAEKRAFGENVVYAGVEPSPFPYEGSEADLNADQADLLALAKKWCRSYQAWNQHFQFFSWVVDMEGTVRRTSVEPKKDDHPVLRPLQRSWGFKRLKELAESGEIRACVLMEIVNPLGDGLVSYHLEARGQPRVSAIQQFKYQKHKFRYKLMRFLKYPDGGFKYNAMRYHIEEPQFFSLDTDAV
ncbi:hypothetical protein [Parasphingopyxis sp.]|uniref:hypothetical protein n=1 Tax=Parasphingopyxis sp. TaxID=1920299 RepID=UPI0026346F25|nr:hypothetical protein [Parasphingopyxis sp.]